MLRNKHILKFLIQTKFMKIPLEKERFSLNLKIWVMMKVFILSLSLTPLQAGVLAFGRNSTLVTKQAHLDLVYGPDLFKKSNSVDLYLNGALREQQRQV